MVRLYSGILFLFLTGCTSFPALRSGLTHLRGQPISVAEKYLGYPDSAYEIDGDKVYAWGVSDTYSRTVPVTSDYRGTITGQKGTYNYTGTATGYTSHIVTSSCSLKLVTNTRGIIINAMYSGDSTGCSGYADALHQYELDNGFRD